MRKLLLFGFAALVMAFMVNPASAEDCVEVDVELPDTVVAEAGAFADGFFELINCGDEASTVELTLQIQFGDFPIDVGPIPVPMGAGQTISHEFQFPVPPPSAGNTFSFCVTAVSGEAEAQDCGEMVILDGTSGGMAANKNFGFGFALADQCLDLSFELPDTAEAAPASFIEGFFELTNCGDESFEAAFEVEISYFDEPIFVGGGPHVLLGAGETVSREFRFPVPPAVQPGTYTICVTATVDSAVQTACQTIEIVDGGMPDDSGDGMGSVEMNNYPNPFNPTTTIAFNLPQASNVKLSVYNVLGQKVRTLASETMNAGQHEIVWDGTNEAGNVVASGIYFYRLKTDEFVESKRMMFTK